MPLRVFLDLSDYQFQNTKAGPSVRAAPPALFGSREGPASLDEFIKVEV